MPGLILCTPSSSAILPSRAALTSGEGCQAVSPLVSVILCCNKSLAPMSCNHNQLVSFKPTNSLYCCPSHRETTDPFLSNHSILFSRKSHKMWPKQSCLPQCAIGLYRENAIAIQIEFNSPEFTRNERNLNCDVLHVTPVRVARLLLDDTIAAFQTSW